MVQNLSTATSLHAQAPNKRLEKKVNSSQEKMFGRDTTAPLTLAKCILLCWHGFLVVTSTFY